MELWDVLDREGKPKGRTIERGQPLRPGDYHLVIHIWIFDTKARFLIQKRAEGVLLFPDIWAATGGSALAGEGSETAAIRELREELGITAVPGEMRKISRIVRADNILDIWLLAKDINPEKLDLQTEEVSAVMYVNRAQLESMLQAGQFYNYGSDYMDLIFQSVCRFTQT